MSIKVVLDKKAQIFIRGLRTRIKTDIPKSGIRMGKILQRNIEKQINAFAENPSGALARSFDVRVKTSSSGNVTVSMTSDLPYARIHETGGRINAKSAPFLVFFYRGRWHRKKSVFIKPKRYLTKAIAASLSELQRETTRTLASVVRTSAARAG